MWFKAPDGVTKVLWEGELQPPDQSVEEAISRGRGDRSIKSAALPVVTIGQPEIWRLSEIYAPAIMPPTVKAKLKTDLFFLVRFSCSFRTRENEASVEWARFQVHLRPDTKGHQPIAFDLHPRLVTVDSKRTLKVGLNPSFKFHEAEAKIGSAEFGIEYTELEPVISGSGIGEAFPSWDFESPRGTRLQSSRIMHLVIRAPKDTKTGNATIDLTADVRIGDSLISALLGRDRQKLEQDLTVQLW